MINWLLRKPSDLLKGITLLFAKCISISQTHSCLMCNVKSFLKPTSLDQSVLLQWTLLSKSTSLSRFTRFVPLNGFVSSQFINFGFTATLTSIKKEQEKESDQISHIFYKYQFFFMVFNRNTVVMLTRLYANSHRSVSVRLPEPMKPKTTDFVTLYVVCCVFLSLSLWWL